MDVRHRCGRRTHLGGGELFAWKHVLLATETEEFSIRLETSYCLSCFEALGKLCTRAVFVDPEGNVFASAAPDAAPAAEAPAAEESLRPGDVSDGESRPEEQPVSEPTDDTIGDEEGDADVPELPADRSRNRWAALIVVVILRALSSPCSSLLRIVIPILALSTPEDDDNDYGHDREDEDEEGRGGGRGGGGVVASEQYSRARGTLLIRRRRSFASPAAHRSARGAVS